MNQDTREFSYTIDAGDRILSANQNWFAFALENGVSDLTEQNVIGRIIWDFISDGTTRHIFEVLFKKVRESGAEMKLPYRCDSPGCKRYMELTLIRRPQNIIEFRSRILREEIRQPVRLLENNINRSNERLVMCGWCKKVRMPDGTMVEAEEAVQILNLFDSPCLPHITHSICEPCGAMFERQIESFNSLPG